MAKIANVALTNTFDTWRTRSNEAFDRLSQFAINNSSLYANTLTSNVAFTAKGTATVTGLLTASGRATVGTNLTVSGNTTLGSTWGAAPKFGVGSGATYFGVSSATYETAVFGPRPANDGYGSIQYKWNAYASTSYWINDYNSSVWNLIHSKAGTTITTISVANTGAVTVPKSATITNNLTVSGNTVLGGANKVANTTGWFGVNGRQSISTNLFVGANASVMGSFGVGTKQPTSPGGTVNIVANTSGSAIIKAQTTSTSTGAARFDLATGTSSSYAIFGLNDNTGNPYLQFSVGTGVLNTYYDSPTHVFRLQNGTEVARFTNGGLKVTANTTLAGTTTDNSNARSQTLTDAATINWDVSLGRVATVTLGAAGRTMAAPTNLKVGTYILRVYQDATGSRTITTWNSVFKWTAAVAPVLSTGAGKLDIITFFSDGTNLYGSYLPDMR